MRTPCEHCAKLPTGCGRTCDQRQRAERLYSVMMRELRGLWPGMAAPQLSWAHLPDYAQRGWLAVAEAARDMER
jgi:hypothetical protein